MKKADRFDEETSRRIRLLARQSADANLDRDLFGEKEVSVPALVKRLGLELHKNKNAAFRGVIRGNKISVRASQSHQSERFVILHEIGHAVFSREFSSLASQLDSKFHEQFATHFAVRALLPERKSLEFASTFPKVDSPTALAKIASHFGFPIALLLQVASWERNVFTGSDKIWLRVKQAANRYTQRDPKLRIVAAHFDHDQWYVPTNKGIDGIIGDTNWLTAIEIGKEVRKSSSVIQIQRAIHERTRKYRTMHISASLAALALRPVAREQGAHLLILATLFPEGEVSPKPLE